MSIAKISIKAPVFIAMIMLALVVVGYMAYTRLPVDLLPNFESPTIFVSTSYPGAGPQEVARQVTEPLEAALISLPGVRNVRSSSRENNSQVTVEFNLEVNPQQAANDVRERVAQTAPRLPSGINQPVVQRFDPSSQPIFTFSVTDKDGRLKSAELRRIVVDQIEPRIERVDGVGDVTVGGGQDRQIQVQLSLDSLRAYRISPSQVVSAIRSENSSVPGGSITQEGQDLLLRTPGEFKTLDDIANVSVANTRGTPLYIRNIGTVVDGTTEVSSYNRLNGKESVSVQVRKQSGTNTVTIAEGVRNEIARIGREQAFRNLTIVVNQDQSEFIRKSIDDSISDLILGGIFASLVVLIFFRNLRNTLVTIAGLPVIMIATFAVMGALNIGLNMMTLLALSIAVGLVIDDAIVVRENIFRHIERGEDPKEAAEKGTNEVALSVTAMTLSVVSVFLPIAFATGQISRFLREFGFAVVGAVLLSLFEAFTLAPMLSAYFSDKRQGKAKREHHEKVEDNLGWLDEKYRVGLKWILHHRIIAAIVSVIVFVAIVYFGGSVQLSFLPRIDNGLFSVGLSMPPGTTLSVTDAEARKIEAGLLSVSEVDAVFANVNGERANFTVRLKDVRLLKAVEPEVREKLKNIKGVSYNFQGAFGGGGTGAGNRPIQLNIFSSGSNEELDKVSQDIFKAISEIPGAADVALGNDPGQPELGITVDRARASRLGLNAATLGSTIRSLVQGDVATRFREPGREADILVRLRAQDRDRLDDIQSLPLFLPSGQVVPLSDVATIKTNAVPSVIDRTNRQTRIQLGLNTVGRTQQDMVNDIRTKLQQMRLPPGVTTQFGGQVQQTADSLAVLTSTMVLSLIFMYMILASQFNSFTQPFVLMLALPLALIGAFLALALARIGADMTAVIGLILLMGLVVKNSILLVDFTNRLRAEGMEREQALLTAGPIRLRPILMTTMSLILGMFPVALGLGAGGSFRSPMAIAVMGGLITSTLLTLFLIPVAYVLMDSAIMRVKRGVPVPAFIGRTGSKIGAGVGSLFAKLGRSAATRAASPHPSEPGTMGASESEDL